MRRINLRVITAAAFLIALGLAPAFTAGAKTKTDKHFGEVAIKTTPAGFPIMIDGEAHGVTNDPAEPIKLSPGPHRVEILFPGKPWSQQVDVVGGKRNCICLSYSRKPLYSPCPYRPAVTAPDTVSDGDTITFTSDVSYTGTKPLTYTWTVTPASAKVISGAGTNSLTVDSTGLGGQRVTAALHVTPGYGDEKCTAGAEAGTDVSSIPGPKKPTDSGSMPGLAFDMDKANLDNFGIQLQNEPDNTGYLVVYSARDSRSGTTERLIDRSVDYLVHTRGIDRGRFVVLNGGPSDTTFIEMWMVPPGAQPPAGTPVPGQTQPAPPKTTRKRS